MNTAHLTTTRKNQIMSSLQQLEGSFSKGHITKATYIQRKDDLQRLLNQGRTLPNSNLARNPGGFFSRNVVNLSPAPVGFLNRFGLKQGQKALNRQTAPVPTPSSNFANQLVNQGNNRATNTDIRTAILEASNRSSWSDLDLQSALNNQETAYQTSVESGAVSGALGLNVTNLPSYDRISKNTTGTYQAEAIIAGFIQRIHDLNFNQSNIRELIEQEARSSAILLYYAQIPPEDIQSVLVNAIVGTSSELLQNYDAMEAINKGANVMNQAKNSPESNLFNTFYNTYGPNNMAMNPSMTDPLKAIDLPTLYAMSQEANGNEANQIEAEITSRQDALSQIQRSSKTNRIQNNATGRGYNTEQAVKNRVATNQAFQSSMTALKAQKADIMNVLDDILRIDGKLILDLTTGQFTAFVTTDELKNAIQGINYALAAEYWNSVERQMLNDVLNKLHVQLIAMSTTGGPAITQSAVSMSVQSPSGNYSSQQSQAAQQSQVAQQSQAAQQSQVAQQSQATPPHLHTNNVSLNYDWYLKHVESEAFPYPPSHSGLPNNHVKEYYAMVTNEIDSNASADSDIHIMLDYWSLHEQMQKRGLFNNAIQGAPRTLGILSGATTSSSTSSAHGAMRAHVANMNNDPREGLYEY